jgi:hypothetical protein
VGIAINDQRGTNAYRGLGLIGDLRAALVGRDGAVDWL